MRTATRTRSPSSEPDAAASSSSSPRSRPRARGYRRARALAQAHAGGARAFAIEGTGAYGARPRADGKRAALQALVRVREGALGARRAALCQLRALIVTASAPLREQLRALTRARLLRRCAALRLGRAPAERGTRLALRLLARRIQALDLEERALKREIAAIVDELAPPLFAEPGIGPISAVQVVVAWSHRGRLRSEAAFARLAGAPPIPASSGRVVRHRLDRGGDRQLNRALHTIIVSRRKHHPATIAYIERRLSDGKRAPAKTIRSLKRYLARHLFRVLEGMPQPA